MEGVSCKSLWTLVSGEGLKTEKGLTDLSKKSHALSTLGITETELIAQKDLLREGLLSFKPNSAQSLERLKKSKDVGESWKDFVIKLAGVMRLEEEQAWQVISSAMLDLFSFIPYLCRFYATISPPSSEAPPTPLPSCSRRRLRPGRCSLISGSSTERRDFTCCKCSRKFLHSSTTRRV